MKNPGKVSLILLLLSSLTSADIIYVPSDTTSIQGGIYLAGPGDTVLVDRGTYEENIDFNGKAITVASYFLMEDDSNHIANTIIDGSQFSNKDSASVVSFVSGEDSTSVLCGFTITGGVGTRIYWEAGDFYYRGGGGILLFLSGGKIVHNKIIDNHIQTAENENGYGGGIESVGMINLNLVIQHNQISYNTVDTYDGGGAGIEMGRYGYILFKKNTIDNNTITANGGFSTGGGLTLWGSDSSKILVTSNKILNNKTLSTSPFKTGWGGGIYINDSSPYLLNNIITKNSAGIGGGIYTTSYTRSAKALPVFMNNTIVQNNADFFGGGFYVDSGTHSLSNPYIINTIIWGNEADQYAQIYIADGSIDVTYSDVQGGWDGEGNIDVDPLFADTSFQLSDSSQCIGAGIATINISDTLLYCPANDIEGNPRPDPTGSNPDIGAYENENANPITKIVNTNSGLPLRFALMQNYPNPFNPSTVISWQLAVGSHVDLTIYNILGEKVATLVDKRQNTGSYQVEWDASGFSSGIYYYQLHAGEFVKTKKLVLLK